MHKQKIAAADFVVKKNIFWFEFIVFVDILEFRYGERRSGTLV